jgi:hypothetical protein
MFLMLIIFLSTLIVRCLGPERITNHIYMYKPGKNEGKFVSVLFFKLSTTP